MARIACDFGTGNTVLARYNESVGHAVTIEIPGITSAMRYRLSPQAPEQIVHVIPSAIHYSATETLIGDQVIARGLADHSDTIRWMKRAIARRTSKRRKTAQGHKSPAEAGMDFLRTVLSYAADQISFVDDEFTFTAPTESFESFQDWLRTVCESLGIRRLRLLDEPTACVLGYHGAARRDDKFVVFDHGCGTLDVLTLKVDLGSLEDRKAIQLGQAGCELGGMDIDGWLATDFCTRHRLADADRRVLDALIQRQAEATKIALSDPTQAEASMSVVYSAAGRPRAFLTTYTRSCDDCERGRQGAHTVPGAGCLGCLLLSNNFVKQARETLERSLEAASIKAGVRRDEIVKVLVTGGTSLVPAIRHYLHELFGGRVEYQNPFDAVARGACCGTVYPILAHDYSIGSYNPQRDAPDFHPLLRIGTEYPTERDAIRKTIGGTQDGQTRCGLIVYEVSRMRRRSLGDSLVDGDGILRDAPSIASEFEYVALNPDNPKFIVADPPIDVARDRKRFKCAFWVDGQRRLLVSVRDALTDQQLMTDEPVVKL